MTRRSLFTPTAHPLSEYDTDELLGFLIDAAIESHLLTIAAEYDQADQVNEFIERLRLEVLSRTTSP